MAPEVLAGAGPSGAVTLGFRVTAGLAEADPAGGWMIQRCRPIESGFRIDLRAEGGRVVAHAETPLAAGERTRLRLDHGQVLAYGAKGEAIGPG